MSTHQKFFIKQHLGFVEEEDDEPEAEETAFTSQQMRLATVASGHFIEWDYLANIKEPPRYPVWNVVSKRSSLSANIQPESDDELDEYDVDEVDLKLDVKLDTRKKKTEAEKDWKKLAKEPYTLITFSQRGEAELVRLLFVTVGERFTEKEIVEDELEDFLKDETPYGSLPIICKDKHVWGGTEAIIRMLARKYCEQTVLRQVLMGLTNHEHLVVEAIYERLCRLKRIHDTVVRALARDVKKRDKLDWIVHQLRYVILPPAMGEWEKLIDASKGPFIVASGMTLADLAITDFLDQCTLKININDLLEDHPALSDLLMMVKKHPLIESYLDERNESDWVPPKE